MYKRFFKRSADLMISILGLLIVSPALVLILLYVFLRTKDNPFFLQKRPGLNEQIFTLIKIRTMANTNNSKENLVSDTGGITGWGKFLRETSLDEIPQLFNVITGKMSLIGPRPLLPEYLPFYSDYHRQRHNVRPGITGWAQINGRNSISWQQKFDLDVWYIKNMSFKVDFHIFLQTVKYIFRKKDVNYSNELTMPWFDGTN